jgi:hypothetical protein
MPLATATPTSLPLALDRQHNYARKWHTHTVLICWLIGVFSISYWRNDYNYEPLISSLRSSQLFQVSIKASAMLGLNCLQVIKTSIFISPTRQRQNQPRMQRLLPGQHRPPTQPVPSLIYPPFARDSSIQEPSSLRFQPPLAGSSLVAAAPGKAIGFILTTFNIGRGVTIAAGLGRAFARRNRRSKTYNNRICYYFFYYWMK